MFHELMLSLVSKRSVNDFPKTHKNDYAKRL